jgi:hypothetical protein
LKSAQLSSRPHPNAPGPHERRRPRPATAPHSAKAPATAGLGRNVVAIEHDLSRRRNTAHKELTTALIV